MNHSEVPQSYPRKHLQLADYPKRHGLSCGECPSACCQKGMSIPLSKEEAWFLIEAGTGLTSSPEEKKSKLSRRLRRQGVSFFTLETDCGHLDLPEDGGPGQCDAFGSAERPLICREFTVGDIACRAARFAKGVDPLSQPGVA